MDTRQKLLDVSAMLLRQVGPDVSVRAVCEAAGVSAPTLYYHFGDRQGLVDATVTDAFAHYLAAKEAEEGTDDLIADLRRAWDLHVSFGRSNPVLYALMFPSGSLRALHPAAATAFSMLLREVERVERNGQLRPGLRVDIAARALWAALYGTTRLVGEDDDPRDAAMIAATVRDAVIDDLIRPR